MYAGAQLTFSILLSPGISHSWGGSSHFNYPSLETLTQTCLEACLLGDCRSCQVDMTLKTNHHRGLVKQTASAEEC